MKHLAIFIIIMSIGSDVLCQDDNSKPEPQTVWNKCDQINRNLHAQLCESKNTKNTKHISALGCQIAEKSLTSETVEINVLSTLKQQLQNKLHCNVGTAKAAVQLAEDTKNQLVEIITQLENNFTIKNPEQMTSLQLTKELTLKYYKLIPVIAVTDIAYKTSTKIISTSVNYEDTKKSVKMFSQFVAEQMKQKYNVFLCLPSECQQEKMCQIAAEVLPLFFIAGDAATLAKAEKKLADIMDLDSIPDRRKKNSKTLSTNATLISKNFTKVDEVKLAGTTKGLKVYNVKYANGETGQRFEYVVNIEGKGDRVISSELPYDKLTGAIDANLPEGKKYLELITKEHQGEASLAFFDVGNLGYVNRNFENGRQSGDQYLKKVAEILKKSDPNKVSVVKLGGDEFGLFILEKDPAKVKQILEKIKTDFLKDKDIHNVFRNEKINQAQIYKKSQDKDTTKLNDFAPYSKQTLSMGSAEIGPGDTAEIILKKAEDLQATKSKINAKIAMNQDASKQGGPRPKPGTRPDPRNQSVPEVQEPIPSNSTQKPSDKLKEINQNMIYADETRTKEIARFEEFSVAEYVNEAGDTSYKMEKYFTNTDGQRDYVPKSLSVNARTGLIDASTENGQFLLNNIIKKPNTGITLIDVKNLGRTNYFEDRMSAGDELLSATADSIKEVLRKDNIGFKRRGSEFIIESSNVTPKELQSIENRLKESFAKNEKAKAVFAKEQIYLQKKIDADPSNEDLKKQMTELRKIMTPDVAVVSTMTKEKDSLEIVLKRIDDLKKGLEGN